MERVKIYLVLLSIFLAFLSYREVLASDMNRRGWYLGGEGVFHIFNAGEAARQNLSSYGYGGGANFWGGRRGKGRLEIRFYFHLADVQVNNLSQNFPRRSPDFFIGSSIEPLFHFLKPFSKVDPYLSLTLFEYIHLVRGNVSAFLVGPGLGFQFHFKEKMSFYAVAKMKVGSTVQSDRDFSNLFILDFEFPVGFAFRF